jgi:hypothetical protein
LLSSPRPSLFLFMCLSLSLTVLATREQEILLVSQVLSCGFICVLLLGLYLLDTCQLRHVSLFSVLVFKWHDRVYIP